MGEAKRIAFDIAHPVHLIRVGERIFRVSLEAIRDKANAERKMFLEYDFAISEVEPSTQNQATAISQEPQKSQPGSAPKLEKILTALNDQPIGTVEMPLRAVVDGRPNVVQISTETKLFLFDPIARLVAFHMVTSDGRSIDLHLPLEEASAVRDSYFIVFVWDNSKGARLHVNDKFVGDGL